MERLVFFLIQGVNQCQKYRNQQGQSLISTYDFPIGRGIFDDIIEVFADDSSNGRTDGKPGCEIPVNQVVAAALFRVHGRAENIIAGHGNNGTGG